MVNNLHIPNRTQLSTLASEDNDMLRILEALFEQVAANSNPVIDEVKLVAPKTITNGGGLIDVLALTPASVKACQYMLFVSFVTKFNATDENLEWKLSDDAPTIAMLSHGTGTNGYIPTTFVSLYTPVAGPWTTKLQAEVIGTGIADLELTSASITLLRL